MADDRNVDTGELENWKPGEQPETDCGFECSEGDEVDCCACCG